MAPTSEMFPVIGRVARLGERPLLPTLAHPLVVGKQVLLDKLWREFIIAEVMICVLAFCSHY